MESVACNTDLRNVGYFCMNTLQTLSSCIYFGKVMQMIFFSRYENTFKVDVIELFYIKGIEHMHLM